MQLGEEETWSSLAAILQDTEVCKESSELSWEPQVACPLPCAVSLELLCTFALTVSGAAGKSLFSA